MAQQFSFLGSIILIVFTGPLFESWALTLRTTASTSTTANDEPFTTKRNAHVIIDLSKDKSQFPFTVVNEVKDTPASTATITMSGKAALTTTTAPQTRRGSGEVPLYRLNGSNGQACILLQVDALITIKYKTTVGEEEEADIYVPYNATVTGNCDDDNFVMSLKWHAFVLSWTFAKTPGGERWYVDKIELTYNSSDRHFKHPEKANKTIRLSTVQKHSSKLFPTPVGKSYSCDEEKEIILTDKKNNATLLLRQMKLQPFKFKNNDFAVEFSCTALSARAGRDETAPVAVGSTLAAAVLLTITGYAGWRYFKVKKFKYDTME